MRDRSTTILGEMGKSKQYVHVKGTIYKYKIAVLGWKNYEMILSLFSNFLQKT